MTSLDRIREFLGAVCVTKMAEMQQGLLTLCDDTTERARLREDEAYGRKFSAPIACADKIFRRLLFLGRLANMSKLIHGSPTGA